MTGPPAGVVVLCGVDDRLGDQIAGWAAERSMGVVREAPGVGAPGAPRPEAVVIALGRAGGAGSVRRWRADHPDAVIVAYLDLPDRDTWEAAEQSGADLVINRGALLRGLRRLFDGLASGETRRRRFPLFDAAEVAGRLGLVRAVDDTPVGPLAVYRQGADLVGVCDVCPHAGARLSGGRLEDGVVTCAAHGSRFEVATGARVRGPADSGLATYTVVTDAGRVWLVWL